MARVLGVDSFGVYAYCLALVTLVAVPAEFGLGTVLIRFVAAYEKDQRWGHLQGLLRWSSRFVIWLSLALAVGAAVIVEVFPGLVPGENLSAFRWSLLLVPIVALAKLRTAALAGCGNLPSLSSLS
jgi:O-antigen/teichoic acid export membrane protein